MSDNKINSMIGDIRDKNLVDAEVKFQSVMNDKVAMQLATAKETLSKSLFNDNGQLDIDASTEN
jgi:hypothetical protein